MMRVMTELALENGCREERSEVWRSVRKGLEVAPKSDS